MPIYFVFDSVERVSDDSVVGFVVADEFMNERNDNSETTTDKRNHNFRSHDITVPGDTGFRLLLWPPLHAIRLRLRLRVAT